MTRIAFDTNILAYMAGVRRDAADNNKITQARSLLGRFSTDLSLMAPAQAVGELFAVLVRAGRQPGSAREIVLQYMELFDIVPTDNRILTASFDLVVTHRFQSWDAIILTAAAQSECRFLLSEDMQDGFVHRGTTIVDPLSHSPHPELGALLK